MFFSKQGGENYFRSEKMTPIQLEVLVHCYVSPEQHPRFFAPAVWKAFNSFLRQGIIEYNSQRKEPFVYVTTEKGEAWLKTILATPQPRQVWVNEKGEIIG